MALQAEERSRGMEVSEFAPLRSLRVVSWNVHQCVGLDARYAPERIARVLRELAPDIVGLQEVDTGRPAREALHQLDFLARATDMAAVAGFNLRRETGDYGNALLTRLPVREVRRLDLSIPRREPRGALDVELAAPGGGRLRAIVTHFGLNPKERRIQADRLGCAIDGHAAGLPTLLVGDLNEWFPGATRRLAALADRFEEEFAGRSFPAPAPFLALDRIYVAPQPVSARCRVWRGWPARLASDHLPLVVDLVLGERPPELRDPPVRAADRRGNPPLRPPFLDRPRSKEDRMFVRSLLASAALAAGLGAAEAQAQSQTTIIYDLPQGRYLLAPVESVDRTVVYRPASPSVDLDRGMWGSQPLTPPRGLVTVEASELVGRTVYDGSGTSFGTIRRLLVDPGTGLAHYAVVSTPEVAGAYIPVPMSAIDLASMEIDMAADDIRLIQAYGMGELERRYPVAALTAPLVVGPVAMAPAGTTTTIVTRSDGLAAGASTATTVPPYRMTQGGDWVGRAVMDPTGELIGIVDYLLTDPGAGAVRQAAVSGGPIGRNNYVLIPAANLRLATGRLIADQSVTALLNSPRLRQAELIQRYGPVVAAQ